MVERSCYEEIREAITINIRRGQSVAVLRGEVVPREDHLDLEELRVALDEDDHLTRPVGPRGSDSVAQIFSAVARCREEVAGCDGHTQI